MLLLASSPSVTDKATSAAATVAKARNHCSSSADQGRRDPQPHSSSRSAGQGRHDVTTCGATAATAENAWNKHDRLRTTLLMPLQPQQSQRRPMAVATAGLGQDRQVGSRKGQPGQALSASPATADGASGPTAATADDDAWPTAGCGGGRLRVLCGGGPPSGVSCYGRRRLRALCWGGPPSCIGCC